MKLKFRLDGCTDHSPMSKIIIKCNIPIMVIENERILNSHSDKSQNTILRDKNQFLREWQVTSVLSQ